MGGSCIICGRSALVTVKNEGGLGEVQQSILSVWKKDCAGTLCEILFGNDKFVDYFEAADFCFSCQKTARDVNLTWKLVSRLQRQFDDLSTMVRKRLHVNHLHIQEKVSEAIVDEMVTTILETDSNLLDLDQYSYDQTVQIFYRVACGERIMPVPDASFPLSELFPEEMNAKSEIMSSEELCSVKIEIEPEVDAEDFNEDLEDYDYNNKFEVNEESSSSSFEEEWSSSKRKRKSSGKEKKTTNSDGGNESGKKKRTYTPGDRRKYYDRAKDTILCQIESCDQKFRSKKDMDAHFLHFHKGIAKPFGCSLCPKKYKWQRTVKDHMTKAHTSDKLRFQHFCKFCCKGYTSEEEMAEHTQEHLKGSNPFACVLCPIVCTNFVSLKKHVQQVHPDVEKPKCEECGKVCANAVTLKLHRLLHQDPSTLFQCPMCPHVSATKNRLNIHLMSHDDSRPFTCETCGKGFKDHRALRNHSVMHTGEILYECKICGKGFRSASSGMRHEEVFHLKVKNHICQVCGRAFGNKSHLNDHLKIHQRESEQTLLTPTK